MTISDTKHIKDLKSNDVYRALLTAYFGNMSYHKYLDSLCKRMNSADEYGILLAKEWQDPRYQIILTGDLKIEIIIKI